MLFICLQKQWFIFYHCWIESLESVLLLSLSLPMCSQTITEHSRKDFNDFQKWFWLQNHCFKREETSVNGNIEINHNMLLHEPSAGDDLIEFEPSLYKIEKAEDVVKAWVAQVDASGNQIESGSDLHENHETGQWESEQPAGAKDANTPKRCKCRRRESGVISLPIAIQSSDIGSELNSTLKKAMSKMVRRQQANQSQQAEGFEQRMTRLEEESKTRQVSKAHFAERMRAMETAMSQRITEHSRRLAREQETDHSTQRCEY